MPSMTHYWGYFASDGPSLGSWRVRGPGPGARSGAARWSARSGGPGGEERGARSEWHAGAAPRVVMV